MEVPIWLVVLIAILLALLFALNGAVIYIGEIRIDKINFKLW